MYHLLLQHMRNSNLINTDDWGLVITGCMVRHDFAVLLQNNGVFTVDFSEGTSDRLNLDNWSNCIGAIHTTGNNVLAFCKNGSSYSLPFFVYS